jgi:hypothetical protein
MPALNQYRPWKAADDAMLRKLIRGGYADARDRDEDGSDGERSLCESQPTRFVAQACQPVAVQQADCLIPRAPCVAGRALLPEDRNDPCASAAGTTNRHVRT